MKKLLLGFLLISTVILFNTSNAQAQYKKGDKLFDVGIGVNSYYSSGTPLGASLEVGITDDISVGGEVDYASSTYSGNYGWTSMYIGARGSYHLSKILNIGSDKFDTYAGLGLGYRSFKWKDSGFGNSWGSGIALNYFAGGKYYFNDKLGAFVELGYIGLSNVKIGLALKF